MLCEKPKSETLCPRFGFLPVLFLNIALITWIPAVRAQVSEFDRTAGEISGTVLLQGDNRPLGQVVLNLKSHSEGVFRSVLTDFDGHFTVRDLPTGTYDILVEEAGYQPVRTKVQLVGSSLKLVLYMMSAKTVAKPKNNYTVSVRDLRIPGRAHQEFEKGLECLAKKDPAGGLSHFTKATKTFPDYYEAFHHVGLAEMELGHMDEALKAFQTAIDLSGGHYARADFGIGYVLCHQGRAEEAERVIRRGLEADDNSGEGYFVLSMALLQLGRLDEAEKSAREAILRKPELGEAYLLLSKVYGLRGDYRAQLQDLNIYLKLHPDGSESERALKEREAALNLLAKSQPQN